MNVKKDDFVFRGLVIFNNILLGKLAKYSKPDFLIDFMNNFVNTPQWAKVRHIDR